MRARARLFPTVQTNACFSSLRPRQQKETRFLPQKERRIKKREEDSSLFLHGKFPRLVVSAGMMSDRGKAPADDISFTSSLASFLDKRVIVVLLDGRKIVGYLRSFDQFANTVLQTAYEQIIVGHLYSNIPLGWYVIRGEHVVLIGELDPTKRLLPSHQWVTEAEIRVAQKAEIEAMNIKVSMRRRMEFLDED